VIRDQQPECRTVTAQRPVRGLVADQILEDGTHLLRRHRPAGRSAAGETQATKVFVELDLTDAVGTFLGCLFSQLFCRRRFGEYFPVQTVVGLEPFRVVHIALRGVGRQVEPLAG